MPYITLLNREWVPGRSDSSVQICAVVVSPAVALCLQRPVCWRAGTESSLAEFGACLTLINGDAAKDLFWIPISTSRSPPFSTGVSHGAVGFSNVKCSRGGDRSQPWTGKNRRPVTSCPTPSALYASEVFRFLSVSFSDVKLMCLSLMGTWNKKRHGGEEETVFQEESSQQCFL